MSRLISALPLPIALVIGRHLGTFLFYLARGRRAIAMSNIARTVGRDLTPRQRRRLALDSFALQGMYVIELLRLPCLTPELSAELVEQDGWEHMEAALAKGKGAILVASHMDNVDLAGCSMSIRGAPITVVAKEIGWAPAQQFVKAIRERTGVELIATRDSGKRIKELLAANKIVTLVVDQHLKRRHSIICQFFGQLANTSPAPTRIALDTGAPIVTGLMHRQGRSQRHVARLRPFALEQPSSDRFENVRHNTERINRVLESWIREFPEQWLWMHKRFKVQDAPEKFDIPEHLAHLAAQE